MHHRLKGDEMAAVAESSFDQTGVMMDGWPQSQAWRRRWRDADRPAIR
jgi:hypothetical protein